MNLKKLAKLFTRKQTGFSGQVTVWDELNPEESAMVQSLNSRSAGGFWNNFLKVEKDGADNFMSLFYSGYGHKSIADCGSTSAAFDNISMLAAKEIQNWWAYNGQETSTRYIDVTGLGFINPLKNETGERIMRQWFAFYEKALPRLIPYLKTVLRKKDGENEKKYNTAIEKRAYDILGAFLPAGTRTNASCHMELRQWDDKYALMLHHPLPEISEIAHVTLAALKERYPSTFVKEKTYEESEKYRSLYQQKFSYVTKPADSSEVQAAKQYGLLFQANFHDYSLIENEYRSLLEQRPTKTDPPKILNEAGNYRLSFLIDFRSHRDLQRQRSALQRVPLLSCDFGFEEWYLDQLPDDLKSEAVELLRNQETLIASLSCEPATRQYYIAMGYKVFDVFTVGLSDLIYIIELRTPTSVHPTARKIAQKAYRALATQLPPWAKLYGNEETDDFDIKRADHDLFLGNKRLSEM